MRFNMPWRSLSELRPQGFPRIGDEENAFNSLDEETDEDIPEPDAHPEAAEEILLLGNEQRRNIVRCTIL